MRLSTISIHLKNINACGLFQAQTAIFSFFLKIVKRKKSEGLGCLQPRTFAYNGRVCCRFTNRCHEANQIYALVEADAERQRNEKTEPWLRKS